MGTARELLINFGRMATLTVWSLPINEHGKSLHFHFNFMDLIFSLCFLMSLANGLSILFILSKNQLLPLLIFAMVSFVSFAFISALIFKISFLLLTLGFFTFSFNTLGVELGYLFDFFLVS